MLKALRKTTERVVDAIVAPTLAEALAAAQSRQAALVGAGKVLAESIAALAAAEDRQAPAADIVKLEATIASARLDAERAQRKHESAERRLEVAQAADTEQGKVAGRKEALEVATSRQAAAGRVGKAIEDLKAALGEMDEHDAKLFALQRQGHVPASAVAGLVYGPNASRLQISVGIEDVLRGSQEPRVDPFVQWSWKTFDLIERQSK